MTAQRLAALDLTAALSRTEYEERLADAQRRLLQLRLHLGGELGGGALGPGLVVVFEGRDAGGKGGAIKRIVEHLDPRHYTVSSYGAPSHDEKRHHFLWRFYRAVPGLGGMCVFDRSWYGRVLVERVEGFATEQQWRRAYEVIVGFERSLVIEGSILVKFWLHISDEEQLARFRRRENDPVQALEAHRGGLAQPGAQPRLRPRRRGDVRPYRSRAGTLGRGVCRAEALRPHRRARTLERAHRGGHAPLRHGDPRPRPG